MGIDWWEHDPTLSSGGRELAEENRQLRERFGALESRGTAARRTRPVRERSKTRSQESAGDE